MGLKQKLVGVVGIVALAGGLAFGGLAVADGSGAGGAAEASNNDQMAGREAFPKKYE